MKLNAKTIGRIPSIATRVMMINPTLYEKTNRDFEVDIDDVRKPYYRSYNVEKLYELLDEFTELIEKTKAELNESNEV